MSMVKAHQRYYVQIEGKRIRVPGTTTITGIIGTNKQVLINWANELGLAGIDATKYRDQMAVIGTCAHYLVECDLTGEVPDLSEFSPEVIDKAENALISWYEWQKNHTVEPLIIEGQMVSERYRFGGTIDLYGIVDGVATLLDFKTSKAIYPEHRIQVAGGYSLLLDENGYEHDVVRILRIGRDESEGFEDHTITNVEACRRAFLAARDLYESLKEV